MQYFGRTPSPPLDQFIERIWYCADSSTHARERVLPGGAAVDLAINLAEDEITVYDTAGPGSVQRRSGSIVCGTRTRSYLIDPRQRASVIGVHFRPGGALPFLGVSPSELVDAHVQLDELWGCDGRNLREQLLEADSPRAQFRLLETALLRRLQCARPRHPAARAALDAFRVGGTEVRVADVAAMVGLSRRRFIEVFETDVGVTPKLYLRLQRFHRVKQQIAAQGRPPSWATFAGECGYFDQSHMIRDFAEFSGISPTNYLRGAADEAMLDHLVHANPSYRDARPASEVVLDDRRRR